MSFVSLLLLVEGRETGSNEKMKMIEEGVWVLFYLFYESVKDGEGK